jgi:hypothetical protein
MAVSEVMVWLVAFVDDESQGMAVARRWSVHPDFASEIQGSLAVLLHPDEVTTLESAGTLQLGTGAARPVAVRHAM